jgi:riboflavin kinase/FMN adenylyltransferase
MRIIESISELDQISRGCVLTIGNFDGVHVGHQEILTTAARIAAERQTKLVAMTFHPHPLTIVNPQHPPGVLTAMPLKKYLLARLGVDCLFVLKSTPEFLSLSPQDFVEQFLVKHIQPGVVVEGESFNFGHDRAGSIHTLQLLAAGKAFEVILVDPREVKFLSGRIVRISSTMIRNMLEHGEAADAAVALGRPYRLIGRVITGLGKGKQLGFPTANMQPSEQLIPADGVYAGFVEIADTRERLLSANEKMPAAFSIGRARTLPGTRPQLVEAHLLTENVGPLVDKWMAMDFVELIRSQIKFDSETQLSAQIAKDCQKAKEILRNVQVL